MPLLRKWADFVSYSTWADYTVILFAVFFTIAGGIGYLAFDYLMWTTVGKAMYDSKEATQGTLMDMAYFMVAIAMAELACLTASEWMFKLIAARRIHRMQTAFASAFLGKEMCWFGTDNEDVHSACIFYRNGFGKIEAGIGVGVQQFIFYTSICAGSYIVAFCYSSQLSLVLLGSLPFMVVGMATAARCAVQAADLDASTFGVASRTAVKTLKGIKTVFSFQQEAREMSKFNTLLCGSKNVVLRIGILTGIGQMVAQGIAVADMGLGLWYMSYATETGVVNPVLDGSGVVVVLTTLVYGSLALGYSAEGLTAMSQALGGLRILREFVNSTPLSKTSALSVDFRELLFPDALLAGSLPTRHFKVSPGQRVAFVSESPSVRNRVVPRLIDFLSCPVGYAGKAAGIFSASLREILQIGIPRVVSDLEISSVIGQVGLGKFLDCLPDGLSSPLVRGEMTLAQERQLGLARALLRDPQLLVLDELTEGLSVEDEMIVELVVRAVAKEYSSVTILSVTNSFRHLAKFDCIYVLDVSGAVVEFGSKSDLIEHSRNGPFCQILKRNDPDLLNASENFTKTLPATVPHWSDHRRGSAHSSIVNRRVLVVENVGITWQRIARLLRFSREFWFGSFLLGVVGATLCGSIPPIVIYVLSEIAEDFDVSPDLKNVAMDILVLTLLGLLMGTACCIREIGFARVASQTIRKLRSSCFAHILRQPVDVHDESEGNAPESIMSSLWSKCYSAGCLTSIAASGIVESVAWFVVAVVIAFLASVRIAVVSVAAILVAMGLYGILFKSLPSVPQDELTAPILEEALNASRMVKLHSGESHVLSLLSSASKSHFSKSTASLSLFMHSLFSSLPFAICPLLTSVGFWYAGLIYVGADVSLSDVIQATYAIGDAGEVAMYIVSWFPDFANYMQDAMKVFDLLDNDYSLDRGEVDCLENLSRAKLEFRKVSFGYSSWAEFAITQISLTAESGQVVGLVGPFKSGKSTLLAIVQRMHDPQYGSVVFNGVNVRQLKLDYWRSLQAVVGQNPILFDLSLRENLVYGSSDATETEIEKVTAICCLGTIDWAASAGSLSTCETARIAIARALLRKPKILLLDEPFAAMDGSIARTVWRNMQPGKEGRVTLIASTNPMLLDGVVDLVYVLSEGKVVQHGTCDELLREPFGIFYKMN